MRPYSLRGRITLGLLAYAIVLSVVLLAAGASLSERREKTIWRALLTESLERDARAAGLLENATGALAPVRLVDLDTPAAAQFPPAIRTLSPGLYERMTDGGITYAILVHEVAGHRIAALTDVSVHERAERRFLALILAVMATGIVGLLTATWWLAGRLMQPVTRLGERVRALAPDRRGERVATGFQEREVMAIEAAVNGFLDRLDAFVLREREFIDTVSHELRTPIAVIAGASEVLADAIPVNAPGRAALDRIRRTVGDMEETIGALLLLAKDPSVFALDELLQLDELLPGIVADHAPLLAGRDTRVELGACEATAVAVPARIAAIVIGNLLRNAIEHTPAGTVQMTLQRGAVAIDNAGAGLDPVAISEQYRVASRSAAVRSTGGGIGLYVIRRLCERVQWRLDFVVLADGALRARLDVSATVPTTST